MCLRNDDEWFEWMAEVFVWDVWCSVVIVVGVHRAVAVEMLTMSFGGWWGKAGVTVDMKVQGMCTGNRSALFWQRWRIEVRKCSGETIVDRNDDGLGWLWGDVAVIWWSDYVFTATALVFMEVVWIMLSTKWWLIESQVWDRGSDISDSLQVTGVDDWYAMLTSCFYI